MIQELHVVHTMYLLYYSYKSTEWHLPILIYYYIFMHGPRTDTHGRARTMACACHGQYGRARTLACACHGQHGRATDISCGPVMKMYSRFAVKWVSAICLGSLPTLRCERPHPVQCLKLSPCSLPCYYLQSFILSFTTRPECKVYKDYQWLDYDWSTLSVHA